MWISKSKYQDLTDQAGRVQKREEREQAFLDALVRVRASGVLICEGIVIMKMDIWQELTKSAIDAQNQLRDVIAERDYYKTRLGELLTTNCTKSVSETDE